MRWFIPLLAAAMCMFSPAAASGQAGESFKTQGTFRVPAGTFSPSKGDFKVQGGMTPKDTFRPPQDFKPSADFKPSTGFKSPQNEFKPLADFRAQPGTFYIGRGFLEPGKEPSQSKDAPQKSSRITIIGSDAAQK